MPEMNPDHVRAMAWALYMVSAKAER